MKNTQTEQHFKKTEDPKVIINLINEKLMQMPLMINLPTVDTRHCEIYRIIDEGLLIDFHSFVPPQTAIILTGFINNYYTEIEITVNKHVRDSLYHCMPNFLRIAAQRRNEPRYDVQDPESIYVRNIRIQKNELEISGDALPLSFKLLMDKYKAEKAGIADEVYIETYENKDPIYKEIQRTGKSLFVANIKENASFENINPDDDLLDIKSVLGADLSNLRNLKAVSGKIGWIICPLLGPVSADVWKPVGYIELISKSPMDFEKFMEIKTLSFEIIEGFRQISILNIQERQQILDVSKSGLRITTKDRQLTNAMMKMPFCICDIFIKAQAPITIKTSIRNSRQLDDGTFQFGMKIEGESSRQDQMFRYHEYIKNLKKTIQPQEKL